MKFVIVYQAYGSEQILKQTLFSLLSLIKVWPSLGDSGKVLIYTDQPKMFQDFFGDAGWLKYEPMGSARLSEWRGDIQFVHRVKIEMLKDAHSLYPNSDIIYLDGDTYFRKDPQPLFAKIKQQDSLMHIAENIIEKGKDPLSKKITRFLKKNVFHVEGKEIKIPSDIYMWNAGVLGLSPITCQLLPAILQFTDDAHRKYQKHVIEQLAFSYFLHSKTQIHSSDDFIWHYWNQKNEYNVLIADFLHAHRTLKVGLAGYDQIKWPLPPPPKVSKLSRIFRKLFSQESAV